MFFQECTKCVLCTAADPIELVAGLLDSLHLSIHILTVTHTAAHWADIVEHSREEHCSSCSMSATH